VAKSNFYYLLGGLLVLFGIEPFLEGLPKSGALIQLAFTAMVVVGVFSLSTNRWAFRLGLGLVAIGLVTGVGYWSTGWVAMRIIDLAAILAFCLLAIGVMLRQVVLEPGAITPNRIVGGMCIYLLLGVVWAVLFGFLVIVEPAAVHYAGREAGDPVEHLLYYSFITLTTLGYGDVTPVHAVARTLAYLEAVTGQLYLAVLIASLVGRYLAGLLAPSGGGAGPAAGRAHR
jgi:hypothetical protein